MVVRRFRDHVAEHNWFAVAVDFLIVVAGVFVGIQASNWNQARLNRAEGRAYRAMLIDDLEVNQHDLGVRKRYYEWVRGEGLKTLAALDEPGSSLGGQFLVDAYQTSQIIPWSLQRNTYDQITAAGQMELVGDTYLRDRISNYYVDSDVTGKNIESVMPYHDIIRRALPYAVQYRIRTFCGEKIGENARGESEMTIPERCTMELDPALLRKAVDQIRNTPALELDLNRQLVDLDQKLVSVDVISRRAAALEQILRRSDH
jgi:hypothetical protein